MPVDVIRLVSGDNKPVIVLTLRDELSGMPYDLTPDSTSVAVRFRMAGAVGAPASTIPCTKLGSGTEGKVQFTFPPGVLDVPAGMYEGEIVITEAGQVQTVYDLLRFRVRENFLASEV